MFAPGLGFMTDLVAFFRDVENAAFWSRLAPWLRVDRLSSDDRVRRPPAPPPDLAGTWPRDGYVRAEGLLTDAEAGALAQAVSALRAHEVHPTFVYVYDETWKVADSLRLWLAGALGYDVELLADVWAWHVDPAKDRGGWPIHRGWYEDVHDPTGAPTLLNVWVSLSDATVRNACIHIVPLPRDPHYPHDLNNLESLERSGVSLPTRAGTALLWSANAAHWGGICDPLCTDPRISMSFTVRRGSGPRLDVPVVDGALSFRDRLDLIADQFLRYGSRELARGRHEMRWAALVSAMRTAASQGARR
ncbi:MAG: phytanoyl-CoA dioxygenase family protein [Myxococcota bacterium]|nr:phytanoyl-CoA dioxygenase family protein [Myxococcota bacterium]